MMYSRRKVSIAGSCDGLVHAQGAVSARLDGGTAPHVVETDRYFDLMR